MDYIDLQLTDFEASDYYGGGSITVQFNNRTYVIKNNFKANQKSDGTYERSGEPGTYTGNNLTLCRNIHSATFFFEDDFWGWSDAKQMHYYSNDCDFDEEPIENEDVTWYTEEKYHQARLNELSDWVNCCEDINKLIADHILAVQTQELDDLVWALKFGPTIVLQPGYLTKLKYYNECGYATIIGERNGEQYDDCDILAVSDRYAIISTDRKHFEVVFVTCEDAETQSTHNDYASAVQQMIEFQEERYA